MLVLLSEQAAVQAALVKAADMWWVGSLAEAISVTLGKRSPEADCPLVFEG